MTASEKETLVLVADDEPSTLALVASHVRSKGFSVLEASDGDHAWQLAHEHLPDLIILDVMMPGMSGWEVCRKVREAVSLAHTGVIMLTGIGENLNEMTSPLYGADTYIDKPFEFSDLDAKIEDTLSRRREGALGRGEAEADEPERRPRAKRVEALNGKAKPAKRRGRAMASNGAARQPSASKSAKPGLRKARERVEAQPASKPERKPKRGAPKKATTKKVVKRKPAPAAKPLKKASKKVAKKAAPKKASRAKTTARKKPSKSARPLPKGRVKPGAGKPAGRNAR